MKNTHSFAIPKKMAAVVLATTLLLTIPSCKKDQTTGTNTPTAVSEVRIGYFANVTHAQAVLGVSSGDFEKAIAPAKLNAKVFNAGPELIAALNAGNIDIGYVGPGPALSGFAKSKGKVVRVLGGAAG